MEAMESMPSHGEEDIDEPVQTTLPPEVGDQVAAIKSAGSAPPPELEDIMRSVESMPSHEVESPDEAVGIKPPPELEELVKAMESMPSHEEEN